jgi:uncharacterized protein with HEPN domain
VSRRSTKIYLHDIAEAIRMIEEAMAGRSLPEFAADMFRRRAIERALEIVSEASRHIPEDLLADHQQIPWRGVRDLGNVLRHAYHAVEAERLWAIIVDDLPALKAAVGAMQAKLAG